MNDQSEKPVETIVEKNQEKHNNWIIGKIFWGLLLMLIGGLVLAGNFGFINVNWTNLWKLWPLFIIAAGLSVLSLNHIIWRIFLIILAILTLGIVAWTLVSDFSYPNLTQNHESSIQITSSNIKRAEINIKAGAGSINITSASQGEVAKANLESNFTDLIEQSSVISDRQIIDFSMGTKSNWWTSHIKNVLGISLTRDLPLTLNVETGATQTNINMSQAKLTAMNLKIGASSLVIRLGDKQDVAAVNIESGVSSITIQIPTASGVQLKIDGGLSSNHLADLTEVSEKTFESPDYNISTKKINIVSKIGLSTFTIERY